MTQRELQRDPAALRVAHHVGALDLQRMQQRRGVVAELLVGHRARRIRGAAVPLLIEHDDGASATKASTHCVIESVDMNAPGMSSSGGGFDSPRSPYTS